MSSEDPLLAKKVNYKEADPEYKGKSLDPVI